MALAGEQIRLRAIERSDAERCYGWFNDRDVTEHLGVRFPMSYATEQEWAERASAANSYTSVQFAIEIAESGEHIGNCGMHDVSPLDRSAGVGIAIGAKEHWGRGYGTDAMRTLITFGFRDMNLRRIMLLVDEDHPGAIKSYERVGFQLEGRERAGHWSRGRAIDFLTMSILREEFDERYGASVPIGERAGHGSA